MAPKFSAVEDECLLINVERHKVLYDAQEKDYKNQDVKDTLWVVVSKEVGRSGN